MVSEDDEEEKTSIPEVPEVEVPPQVFDLRDGAIMRAFRRVLAKEKLDELYYLLQDINIPTGKLDNKTKKIIMHDGFLALDLLTQKLRNKGQLSFDFLILKAQAEASLMARISRGEEGFTLRMAVTRRFEQTQPSQRKSEGGFLSRIFG